MTSNQLHALLASFRLLANRHTLYLEHRAIQLAPDHIKACASFGLLDICADLGIDDTVYIDMATFLAVMSALPEGKDITFRHGKNTLNWRCGDAGGRFALLALDKGLPEAVEPPRLRFPVTRDTALTFRLGAMSADDVTPGHQLYGVLLDTHDGRLKVCSTDNHTASCAIDDVDMALAPDETTISLYGAELLAAVIRDGGELGFTEGAVCYYDDTVTCQVQKLGTRMNADRVRKILDWYSGDSLVVEVPPDRINAFVKRAIALAESRREATVSLAASDYQIRLTFNQGIAVTDELFMTESLPEVPAMAPINIAATKLARALQHTNEVVLDHMARRPAAVVFRSGNNAFRYIISDRWGRGE